MNLRIKVPIITSKYGPMLAVLLSALIMAGAYFLLFDGQLREKKRLEADVSARRQELARMAAIKANMDKIRRSCAELKGEFETRMRQIPDEKEVPDLLRQVSLAAQESRIRLRYFAPKESKPRDLFWELPFEMKYTAPYHSAGYFFDGIRGLERIVHVTSFSLEAKEAGRRAPLEGTCLAKTYVFMKDPPKERPQEKKAQPVDNRVTRAAVTPNAAVIPNSFAYSSQDKRDPFEPVYIARTEKKGATGRERKEGYDLDELKFVGVVKSGGTNSAMMEDVQGRGLLFKKGDFINKNLWVLEMLDDKMVLAYKLRGDIHKISLDIPRR